LKGVLRRLWKKNYTLSWDSESEDGFERGETVDSETVRREEEFAQKLGLIERAPKELSESIKRGNLEENIGLRRISREELVLNRQVTLLSRRLVHKIFS